MQFLTPASIPSEESVPDVIPARLVLVTGIPTQEDAGQPRFVETVVLGGITDAEAVGSPRFVEELGAGGITSAESIGTPTLEVPEPPPYLPFSVGPHPLTYGEQFSTPIIDQNQAPTATYSLRNYNSAQYDYYQWFVLPRDFPRGVTGGGTIRVPSLTGLQFFVDIDQGYEDVAALDYTLERLNNDTGVWESLAKGTAVGADLSGNEVWMSAFFDDPVDIQPSQIDEIRYRFGIRGRNPATSIFKEEVPYQNGQIQIGGTAYPALLKSGDPYHLLINGVPNVFYLDDVSGKVYRSTEGGVSAIHATTPNPLITSFSQAYDYRGDHPGELAINGTSFLFRILAGTAEDGTDFLGDRYRSVAIRNSVVNVSTTDQSLADKYWLSRPNPSRFGVESLYFDVSSDGNPVTVDRVLLDPLTPGIYFNVYWSNDGVTGTNETEWEQKLWAHVPYTFHLTKRDTYALPQPITAKYLKVEFSGLQPQWYAPGNFQKPTLYKKYPKWVLDYFLVREAAQKNTEDTFISPQVQVQYNALDLAYNYYLDDIQQEPASPVALGSGNSGQLQQFLSDMSDASDQVDSDTLNQIKIAFFPYVDHPANQGNLDYLPTMFTQFSRNVTMNGSQVMRPDFPTEDLNKFSISTDKVSTLDREPVLDEKGMPIMFFYVTCRHKYRVLSAEFKNDRAYFAGVREIAFMRDRYEKETDTSLYVDHAGDNANAQRNDFSLVDLAWQTYDPNA